MLLVEKEYKKKYMSLNSKKDVVSNYLSGFNIDMSFFEDFMSNNMVKTYKERLYMVNKKKRSEDYISKKKNSRRLKIFLAFSKMIRDNKLVFDHKSNKILINDKKVTIVKDFLKKHYQEKQENHGFLKFNPLSFTLPMKKTYRYCLKIFFVRLYRRFFKKNFNTKGSKTYKVFSFFKRLSLRVNLLQQAFFQIRKEFNLNFLKPAYYNNSILSIILLFLLKAAIFALVFVFALIFFSLLFLSFYYF